MSEIPFVFVNHDGSANSVTSCCKAITELLGCFECCKRCGCEVESRRAPEGIECLDKDPDRITALIAKATAPTTKAKSKAASKTKLRASV
jgi:hypothetical protein